MWKNSFFREYLNELIAYKISVLKKELEGKYRDERWKEITRTVKEIEIFLSQTIKMKLYTESYLSKSIYFDLFEKKEIAFLEKNLKKGDVFIDIGANVGLFTLIAARQVGNEGIVHSFEPTPSTYSKLIENIELNNFEQCKTYNIALSSDSGQINFNISNDGYDAFNTIGKLRQNSAIDQIVVETRTFDSLVDSHKESFIGNKVFMKIDVEGWELPVLKGSKNFLKESNNVVLMVEFTDENAIDAGFSCKEVYQYLSDLGYSWFEIDDVHNGLIESPLKNSYPYCNLIAFKHEWKDSYKIV